MYYKLKEIHKIKSKFNTTCEKMSQSGRENLIKTMDEKSLLSNSFSEFINESKRFSNNKISCHVKEKLEKMIQKNSLNSSCKIKKSENIVSQLNDKKSEFHSASETLKNSNPNFSRFEILLKSPVKIEETCREDTKIFSKDLINKIYSQNHNENNNNKILSKNEMRLLVNTDDDNLENKQITKNFNIKEEIENKFAFKNISFPPKKEFNKILSTGQHNQKNLKKHKKVFDSLSDEEEEDLTSNNLKDISNYIISPKSTYKRTWDILVSIGIIYSVFVVPYIIAFDSIDTISSLTIDTIIDFSLLIDIILTFFTGYLRNDILVLSLTEIRKKYIRRWFLFDLVSAIPFAMFEIIYFNDNNFNLKFGYISRFIKLLKWMRLFRIIKLFSKTKNEMSKMMKNLRSPVLRALELIFFLVFIAHFTSCIFIFIGKLNSANNWIFNSGMIQKSDLDIFICAVYYIFTTIFTIGYGDIVPITIEEITFIIFLEMFGCAIFSYTLSSFANALIENDTKTQIFNNKERLLDEIDEEHRLPELLYSKLKKVITYDYLKWNEDYISFIRTLPSVIKNQLFIKIFQNQIQILHFFDSKSYDFIVHVIPLLRSGQYHKGETIIQIGEIIDEIYLVIKGCLSILLGSYYLDYEIAYIKAGYHFGDILMYCNEQSNYNIKINTKSAELMILKKNDFAQIKLMFSNETNDILKKSLEIHTVIERRRFLVYNYYDKYKTLKNFKFSKYEDNVKLSQIEPCRPLFEDKIMEIDENIKNENLLLKQIEKLKNEEIRRKKIKIKRSDVNLSTTHHLLTKHCRSTSHKRFKQKFKTSNLSPSQFKRVISEEYKEFQPINNKMNPFEIECNEKEIIKSQRSTNSKNSNKTSSNHIFINNLNLNYDLPNMKFSANNLVNNELINASKSINSNNSIYFKKTNEPLNKKISSTKFIDTSIISKILPRRRRRFTGLFSNSKYYLNNSPSNNLTNYKRDFNQGLMPKISNSNLNFKYRRSMDFPANLNSKNMIISEKNNGFLDELNIQIENEGFLNKNQEIVSDHIKNFLDLKGIESKNLNVQYKKLKLIENYIKRIYKNN